METRARKVDVRRRPQAAVGAHELTLRLGPWRVVEVLGSVAALLVAAHVFGLVAKYRYGHGRLLGFVPLFDLDTENNVPTYFSALLFLSCAALFAVIAAARRRLIDRDWRYWSGLAALFLFLSFDEASMFHDGISRSLRDTLDTSGIFFDAWVLPYGVLFAVLAVFYIPFTLRLPAQTRNGFVLAGLTCMAGAFWLEMVAGYYWTSGNPIPHVRAILQTFEEALEMIGLLILIHAQLTYIAVELRGLRLGVVYD